MRRDRGERERAGPGGLLPVAGWKDSFFGDLHATGRDGVEFYIGRKVGISRWPGARARRRGPRCGEYLVTREEQQER